MSNVDAPHWSWGSPSSAVVRAFLDANEAQPFGYAAIGATRGEDPVRLAGFNFDCSRVLLGRGEAVFERSCAALRAWRMFPAPWTRIAPGDAPIREGQVLTMAARAFGLWWLNACRIVYVMEEDSVALGREGGAVPVRRFGFAYGTLSAHVEAGEERFSVEWHADGTVWYDLRAFSRPRYWPVRVGKPLARRLQRRFVRESLAAMQRAVAGAEVEA